MNPSKPNGQMDRFWTDEQVVSSPSHTFNGRIMDRWPLRGWISDTKYPSIYPSPYISLFFGQMIFNFVSSAIETLDRRGP